MNAWCWPTRRDHWPTAGELTLEWPDTPPPPLVVGDYVGLYGTGDADDDGHWLGLWQVTRPWRWVTTAWRLWLLPMVRVSAAALGPSWNEVAVGAPPTQPTPLTADTMAALWPALLDAQLQPATREGGRLRPLTTLPPAAMGQARPLHDEIQQCLVDWGGKLGLQVWLARNDRQRQRQGDFLRDRPFVVTVLPQPFDPLTRTIVEHIDVLWLQDHTLVAAFEIECTTTVYAGLLRLADLSAVQPHLHTPLYLVAPQRRAAKIRRELHRPTFKRLAPPLHERCRFLPWEPLQRRLAELTGVAAYLNPRFLDDLTDAP